MSYDISFKVKVEGVNEYVEVGDCDANITWNVREIITRSTGLPWDNEKSNGLCKDVIPHILNGYHELLTNGDKYEQYEASNGWGTVHGTTNFFKRIIDSWEQFCRWYPHLIEVTTFWIE